MKNILLLCYEKLEIEMGDVVPGCGEVIGFYRGSPLYKNELKVVLKVKASPTNVVGYFQGMPLTADMPDEDRRSGGELPGYFDEIKTEAV